MRFPVGNTGTKEEFNRDWYIASGFGENRGSYYHEGLDINLRTGGDTDLGKEVKAIANGRIIYYHNSSHPTINFGRHLVYKIDGAWGTRWIHCAHMLDQDFLGNVQDVSEGQIIGRIGKSGTVYAHLHFAVFHVDPATLAGGIDNIANTLTELNQVWENPETFINTWMAAPVPIPPPVTGQTKFDFGPPWGIMELQQAQSILNDQNRDLADLRARLETIHQLSG